MATFYAGTHGGHDWTARVGACLTDDLAAAREYGSGRTGRVFQIEVDWDADFTCTNVDVSREDIDANNWPGDKAASIAALVSDGWDMVSYGDMDTAGREHTTWRLLTDAAIAAVISVVELAAEVEDED